MTQVVHVVLVDWAEDAPGDVGQQADALAERHLRAIPGVVDLDHGASVSGEGLERGFDWAMVIRFADEASLTAYLPDAEHRVVADFLGAHSSDVVVFDLASR